MNKLAAIKMELARSFVLSGDQAKMPPVELLFEQAGAIFEEDELELAPIPGDEVREVFREARKLWRLPGYSELRKTYESASYRELRAERARRRFAALPAPPPPPEISPAEARAQWEQIWREARDAGLWVPDWAKKL